MAVLFQRGLRALPRLAWAPRRAAAASWPGDPEPPDPALEEMERCGALCLPAVGACAGQGAHSCSRRARRRRAAARMERLRRELGGGRGAPDRALTWQAMEQLR